MKIQRLLIAITFLITILLSNSSIALAAPKIEWTPGEIQVTLSPGQGATETAFATFTSSTSLDQVTLEVVPSLSSFVTVEPAEIGSVQAGVPQTIALHFTLPPGTEPGTYEGVLHVRSGKRTVPHVLKISITVTESASQPEFLLGTDLPTTNTDAEAAVYNLQVLMQRFTLTSAVNIETLKLSMSGFGVDQFTVWITNAIGPGTTQANVLFQTNLTFPNTGGGISGAPVSTPVNLTLQPGEYFIVLSSTQPNLLQGWLQSNAALPSTVGTVGTWEWSIPPNLAFPPASVFIGISPRPAAFQLIGNELP